MPTDTPPEPAKASKIQHAAVTRAIEFLKLAGAYYTIDFDGKTLHNRPKPDFSSHFKPLLEKHKESFVTTLAVPEEFDYQGYVVALRNWVQTRYGPGNYTTEGNKDARTIEILATIVKEGKDESDT